MTKEEIEKEAEKRYPMSNRGLPMLSEEDYINEKSQDAFLAGFDFAQSQSKEQRYKETLEKMNPRLEEIRIEVAKTFAALSSERIDRMIYELSIDIFKVLE